MLYIEDTDGSQWLEVVTLMAERGHYDMALRLYPGADSGSMPEPFEPPEFQYYLESVNEYPDAAEPVHSARLRVTAEEIDDLRSYLGEFEDWGDSLALYPVKEQQWVAAYVPAQRVVLVRDVRLYDFLDAAGLTVTLEKPDGS